MTPSDWAQKLKATWLPAEGSTAASRAIADQFTQLVDRYQQPIFSFLVVVLRDQETAKDCAQDVFLRAYQQLAKSKPVTVQWLYTVARNRAIDEFRHRRRENLRPEPIDAAAGEMDAVPEDARAVHRALQRLSPDDREVLYLAEVDGFTSIEIGAMLGLKPGTVRMRLSRAHTRFQRAYLEPP